MIKYDVKLREVAQYLSLSTNTIKRKRREGLLKATMTTRPPGRGGRPYWDITEEEVKRYLKQYE